MSAALRLPPALLDWTLVRASARLHSLNPKHAEGLHIRSTTFRRRYAQQSALLARRPAPPTHYYSDGGESDPSSYTSREPQSRQNETIVRPEDMPKSMSELEHRVQALEVAAGQESAFDPPSYSESDLLTIYEDLLALPSDNTPALNADAIDEEVQEREDTVLVQGVARRLLENTSAAPYTPDSANQYTAVIARLREVSAALHGVRVSAGFAPSQDSQEASAALRHIPTGILTNKEWSSLVRTCVRAQDAGAAEIVLDLMKTSGAPELEEALDSVLGMYAKAGDIANTERFLRTAIRSTPTERQRDLHIKAYLKSLPPRTFPTAALEHLHAYEERGLAAPQRTYTRVIGALLNAHAGAGPAHAWDLFAHMRYVAHPVPDVALYTLMVSACGDPHDPQPERALDLFAEMTRDKGLAPTARTYSAAMMACARSGQTRYVHEAFRLAKEMLDANRDAHGRGAFRPDTRLFMALLEGAKRVGDLARVRWILAEMIRESAQEGADVEINDLVMMHVFHAYGTYRPPFVRGATVLLDKDQPPLTAQPPAEASQHTVESSDPHGASESSAQRPTVDPQVSEAGTHTGLQEETPHHSFSHLPPQTQADLVHEAQALFARILRDTHTDSTEETAQDDPAPGPFRRVRLTPRLLNAYLAVHYSHAPLRVWSSLYRTLFAELDVARDAHSYVTVLERCARAREQGRADALALAEKVWAEWARVERAWRAREDSAAAHSVDARLVERAHTAMVHLLSITRHVRRALEHVRAFAAAYPPGLLRAVPPKPALRSSRTVLRGARPLVRLTSAVDVPDAAVPPLLAFADVRVLHQRLAAAGDAVGIRYLGWVCRTYEGALRRRREATLRAKPVAETGTRQEAQQTK